MQKNRAVLDIIVEMFPVSAKVGALALLWAIIVGVPLGCLAAFKRGKLTDSILRVICTLGISMPSFVVASVLLVTLTGDGALNLFPSIFDASQGIRAYILPCFALGFYPMCYTARQTRSAMLDSLSQEYIKTARAKETAALILSKPPVSMVFPKWAHEIICPDQRFFLSPFGGR